MSDEVCEAARRIRDKNPGRVPIICEKDEKKSLVGWVTRKQKFLVSEKLNVSQFRRFVRSNLIFENEKDGQEKKKAPKVALYLKSGQELSEDLLNVAELDRLHKSADGFLYLMYVTKYSSKNDAVVFPETTKEIAKKNEFIPTQQRQQEHEKDDEQHQATNQGEQNKTQEEEEEEEETIIQNYCKKEKKDINEQEDEDENESMNNSSNESTNNSSNESTNNSSYESTNNSSNESTNNSSNESLNNEENEAIINEENEAIIKENELINNSSNGSIINEGNEANISEEDSEEDSESDNNNGEIIEEEKVVVECPATSQDLDELYKSPMVKPRIISDSPPPSFDLNEKDEEFHESTTYSRTVQISNRNCGKMDSILSNSETIHAALNGFDSMVLSDDSSGHNPKQNIADYEDTDEDFNDDDDNESMSGWPALSRESTIDDKVKPKGVVFDVMTTNMQNNHHTNEINRTSNNYNNNNNSQLLSNHTTANEMNLNINNVQSNLPTNSGGDDWIEVDTNEPSDMHMNHATTSSLETPYIFFMEKISNIPLPNVNKEAIASKTKNSLRKWASNMGISRFETTNNQSDPIRFPFAVSTQQVDEEVEEEWTSVNFDGKNESFGAHFL